METEYPIHCPPLIQGRDFTGHDVQECAQRLQDIQPKTDHDLSIAVWEVVARYARLSTTERTMLNLTPMTDAVIVRYRQLCK